MPVSQALRDKLAAATQKVLSGQTTPMKSYYGETSPAASSPALPKFEIPSSVQPPSGTSTPTFTPTYNSALQNGLTVPKAETPKFEVPTTPKGPATSPTYNEQPVTNYGGKNAPLNEILYSKKQYDAGNKAWAQNNAQQYYAELEKSDPALAAQVHNMSTQDLIDYIEGLNTGAAPATVTQQTPQFSIPTNIGTTPPPASGGTPTQTQQTPQFVPPTPSGTTTGGGNAADLPTQVTPIQPSIPVMDEQAIKDYAAKQVADKLAQLRLDADAQIQTGKTTADKQVAEAKTVYEQYLRQLQANYDQATGTAKTDAAKQLASAQAQYDQFTTSAKTDAQSALATLQTQFDRTSQNINEDRGVENVQNARRLSPFSGKSDYTLGVLEQERARTDRERQEDLASSQGGINANLQNTLSGANTTLSNAQQGINQTLEDYLAGANQTLANSKTGAAENLANIQNASAQSLADLENQINAKYAALQNAAPDEQEALFQSIKNDERNYELMVQGQLNQDLLTNSQLNNTGFNQALQTWETNQAARQQDIQNDAQYAGIYKNAPTFDAMQQNIQNDAVYGGTYKNGQSLQGAAQSLAQQQANQDAAFGYMDRSGQILSPQQDWSGYARQIQAGGNPLTLQGQQQQQNNIINQANLTGYMPNGQKTTQQQQQDLQNLWTQADYTGTIPDQLADLYGIPRGTQTQQAKQWAQNFAQQQDQYHSGIDEDLFNFQQKQNQQGQTSGMSAADIAKSINGSPLLQSVLNPSSSLDPNASAPSMTDPNVRNQIEAMIITQTQDPITAVQLYNMYGIPVPTQLQQEYQAALAGKMGQ